jgi:hypothetical protein
MTKQPERDLTGEEVTLEVKTTDGYVIGEVSAGTRRQRLVSGDSGRHPPVVVVDSPAGVAINVGGHYLYIEEQQ